ALMSTLRKRADDDFNLVPGTVDQRAEMLEAIGKMEKPLAEAFTKVLTHSQKVAKMAFNTISHGGGDPAIAKSAQGFEAKVAEIKKRDSCSGTEAMKKARKEDPDGFEAYQKSAN